MYEDFYPGNAPRKVRALLFDAEDRLVLLRRTKPKKKPYHVTAGGKVDPGEGKREALARELREELDATVVLGRPFLTVLDTIFYVARAIEFGPNPFNGPEFKEEKLGRYAIDAVDLADVQHGTVDLQPHILGDFLRGYGEAVLQEARHLGQVSSQTPSPPAKEAPVAGNNEASVSGLARRIAEGKAYPISDVERAQLVTMREIYTRRFGVPPQR